ncbi:hypothetical protein BS47DRAFT_1391480 [Hydnum rufescens UP504]|uniref:Uncharacterized protein n=1 Tax=Hydnum rufescens UP504 TaxID=1448309 RepID=A0A9P6B0X5_9AGAM|nr:hypothetical protein BS47DRAFT_1391480 [Hydnum rufescens UP504]
MSRIVIAVDATQRKVLFASSTEPPSMDGLRIIESPIGLFDNARTTSRFSLLGKKMKHAGA